MIDPEDLAHCEAAIQEGSYSFHAASKLLPARVRDPALALYAFCRLADDAVDLSGQKPAAVLDLGERLDQVYAGRPRNAAPDRAFAAIVEDFDMPRALPEALLEGLAWDGMGRRYVTLSELRSYSARVASAVGAMMCVLMEVRDAEALARACDLGVAMQLTNIARDVGEDAREGRLYLPTEWLEDAGIDPDAFLNNPRMCPKIARLVRQLLTEARRLYIRSEAGVKALPLSARPGIFAARYIYAAIGNEIRAAGYDSINRRARTSAGRKLALLGVSVLRAGTVSLLPQSPVIHARSLEETAFLVDAAAHPATKSQSWSDPVLGILADLKARDHASELDRQVATSI